MHELGRSQLIGNARTDDRFPLIITTRWNIPFLLHAPGHGQVPFIIYTSGHWAIPRTTRSQIICLVGLPMITMSTRDVTVYFWLGYQWG